MNSIIIAPFKSVTLRVQIVLQQSYVHAAIL